MSILHLFATTGAIQAFVLRAGATYRLQMLGNGLSGAKQPDRGVVGRDLFGVCKHFDRLFIQVHLLDG